MSVLRKCPKCGADEEDMVFAIDETVDCYVCNWKGHEDDVKLVERPDLARGEDGTQDMLDDRLGGGK